MELDTLVAVISVIFVVLTNLVVVTFTYGKIVARLSHVELDIVSLKKRDETQRQELNVLYEIQGQLKVFTTLLKKD